MHARDASEQAENDPERVDVDRKQLDFEPEPVEIDAEDGDDVRFFYGVTKLSKVAVLVTPS